MMTKKEARRFKAKTDLGEWPPLPKWVVHYLEMPSYKIKQNIRNALSFGYGNGTYAARVIQMGLLDKDYYLTSLGQEYWNKMVIHKLRLREAGNEVGVPNPNTPHLPSPQYH